MDYKEMEKIEINLEDSSYVDLDDLPTAEPKNNDIGVPSDEIINIMLNDYIKTNDKALKEQLQEILNKYQQHLAKDSSYGDRLYFIAGAIPLEAIITPEKAPNYNEAVESINNLILKVYIQMTRKDAPVEMLNDYIRVTVEAIAFDLFTVYNMEIYNNYVDELDNLTETRVNYIKEYKEAETVEERLEIQKKASNWESEKNRDLFISEYRFNTSKEYDVNKAIDYIQERLIKELGLFSLIEKMAGSGSLACEAAPNYGAYDKEDIFEVLDSITPTNYIIPNNKLINKLAAGEIYKYGKVNIDLYDKDGAPIPTIVRLNYDDNNIHIEEKDKRFTPYHRAVYNAICSIKEAGNEMFTPDQVYRCMNGYVDGEPVSKVAREVVIKTIEELRDIKAWIDYSKEAKDRGYGQDKFIVNDYIVAAKGVRIETGGQVVDGYKFNSKPLLYEYAQISGQVITIPITNLDTRNTLRYSEESLVIKNYIIRQIEWMKNTKGKKRSNNIVFESIHEELGLDNPTSYKVRRIRENTIKLLDDFKEKGIIENYKIVKRGRKFHGAEILY